MFLNAAVIPFFNNVNDQRIARKVTVIIINGPVHIEEPEP